MKVGNATFYAIRGKGKWLRKDRRAIVGLGSTNQRVTSDSKIDEKHQNKSLIESNSIWTKAYLGEGRTYLKVLADIFGNEPLKLLNDRSLQTSFTKIMNKL